MCCVMRDVYVYAGRSVGRYVMIESTVRMKERGMSGNSSELTKQNNDRRS